MNSSAPLRCVTPISGEYDAIAVDAFTTPQTNGPHATTSTTAQTFRPCARMRRGSFAGKYSSGEGVRSECSSPSFMRLAPSPCTQGEGRGEGALVLRITIKIMKRDCAYEAEEPSP